MAVCGDNLGNRIHLEDDVEIIADGSLFSAVCVLIPIVIGLLSIVIMFFLRRG